LELALACHYRIAIDNPTIKFGFPEVTLGLIPGGGGVTRLTRMLGIQEAMPYMMEGKQLNPSKALGFGIIDKLAVDQDDMMEKARAWIQSNPQAAQSWDKSGYRMPGGTPLEHLWILTQRAGSNRAIWPKWRPAKWLRT
jgi:3-hydroxyacyl-CoA dehydrogenase/enoyl-CoA hydratase/3-hydroxybutyryl-CoA epimerase